MKFIEYPDREMMMLDLAHALAGEIRRALKGNDTVSVAVPGGTTPGPVFDALGAADLEWDRVRVMLTDERWVPEDSPRSNTRLLREHLLSGRAAAAVVVPLYAPAERPEDRLAELSAAVAAVLPLSVLLLGMGEDAHIASLFPGADRLAEALADDAPPLLAMRAPGVPEPRVTLSAPVLTTAIRTHILITGAAKRAAIERAENMPPSAAPAALVLGQATVHWAE